MGTTLDAEQDPVLPPSGWARVRDEDPGGRTGRTSLLWWAKPVLIEIAGAVWSAVVASSGMAIAMAVVGGFRVDSVPLLAGSLGLAVLVLDAVLNPVLRAVASLGSVVLSLLLGISAQMALLAAVFIVATDDTQPGWTGTVTVLVITAGFISVGRWLVGATDSGYVVGAALGPANRWRARRARGSTHDPSSRGLLIVQLDGVSHHVLLRAIDGGQAPNLARWLNSSHRLSPWWATVPSTTPATLAGLLHGQDDVVPAFRWWDRTTGRLLAASRPADTAIMEGRFAPGSGLLREGGTAISTTFSGEADTTLLTVSRAVESRGLGSGASYLSFFSRPFLLPSALLLTLGEMVKEIYQGHRQRIRGVEPRISRGGAYIALRGITNVLLRKLNLSLVVQEMTFGRPIIFVDFVDYDEIAHHAGPERPEALRALEGLDAVLGSLLPAAAAAPRDYELIVLSDHGQSLGATFEQVTGRSLADHVALLMHEEGVAVVEQSAGEEWGPVNALVTSVLGRWTTHPERVLVGPDRHPDGEAGRTRRAMTGLTRRAGTGASGRRVPANGSAGTRRQGRTRPASVARTGQPDSPAPTRRHIPQVAVTGGGNLGMVWFPRLPDRPSLVEINARWPGLVTGLLATRGIGLLLVAGPSGPLVLGRGGVRDLTSGTVDGQDPLEGYPLRASDDLIRLHAVPDSGDLVVFSRVDDRGHIHAFEHQVGSHGGIGGPQNEGIFIYPKGWDLDPDLLEEVGSRQLLVGPVALHRQILRWRRRLGAGPYSDETSHVRTAGSSAAPLQQDRGDPGGEGPPAPGSDGGSGS